jgi:hypothetical protein
MLEGTSVRREALKMYVPALRGWLKRGQDRLRVSALGVVWLVGAQLLMGLVH